MFAECLNENIYLSSDHCCGAVGLGVGRFICTCVCRGVEDYLNRHRGGHGHPMLNNLERGTLFVTHAPGFSMAADAILQTVCMGVMCSCTCPEGRGYVVEPQPQPQQTHSEQI